MVAHSQDVRLAVAKINGVRNRLVIDSGCLLLARRAEVELIVGIHFQDLNGRPSGGCLAGDVDSLPCEMILPPLLARMKECGNGARERNNACEVRTFAQVAVYAREAEVGFVVGAAVLARARCGGRRVASYPDAGGNTRRIPPR